MVMVNNTGEANMALKKEHVKLIVGNILECSEDGDVSECKDAVKEVIGFMREEWGMPKLTQEDNETIWREVCKTFMNKRKHDYYTISFMKGTKQALKIKSPLVIVL
jgi:hypothetical protein